MRLASFCAPKHVSLWWTDAVNYDIGVSSTNRCCSITVLCDARGHGDQISVSGIFLRLVRISYAPNTVIESALQDVLHSGAMARLSAYLVG